MFLIERTLSKISNVASNRDDEISKYFKAPVVSFSKSSLKTSEFILKWWFDQASDYPLLSEMARDYLSSMPTSVSSERAFSFAGLTITDLRSRLHKETSNELLCLFSWIKINKSKLK